MTTNNPNTPIDIRAVAEGSSDLDAVGMQGDAGADAANRLERVVLHSGVDPRQAAQIRWSKHRARQEADHQRTKPAGETALVRVPVEIGTIVTRLEADARSGNIAAARELRAWRAEIHVEPNTGASDLDKRARQTILARLLAEIEQEP